MNSERRDASKQGGERWLDVYEFSVGLQLKQMGRTAGNSGSKRRMHMNGKSGPLRWTGCGSLHPWSKMFIEHIGARFCESMRYGWHA